MARPSLVAVVVAIAFAAPARADGPKIADTAKPAAADVVGSSSFDAKGWTRLGQVVLSGRHGQAKVTLRATRGAIDQLALIADSELDITGVTVIGAGGKAIHGTRQHVWATARFTQVDLPGTTRRVRAAAVTYRLLRAATATLTVYGRNRARAAGATIARTRKPDEQTTRTNHGQAAPAELGISSRTGWTLLGGQAVERTHDRGVIVVNDTAAFAQLAVVVTGGDLELSGLRLRFAGGTTADLGTKYFFRGSDRSRVMTLPTGATVKRVQLQYGPDRGHGTTRVEVWAR